MGEKLSREESAIQRRELQQLMMEAYATDWPEVGLLVETDEPELLYNYLHAVKQEDPALTKMTVGLTSSGVVIYHDQAKASAEAAAAASANVGVEDEQKDSNASNGQAHSDL